MNLPVIQPAPEPTAIDPVCGMTVKLAKPGATLQHEGHDFYFCCQGCANKFQADPVKYLNKDSEAKTEQSAAQPAAGTQYTCPMDPEIVRDKPGICPICGMALEPMTATLDDVESRAGQHDAPPLDRRRSHAPAAGHHALRPAAGQAAAASPRRAERSAGWSSLWPRRSCSGQDGRSFSAAGPPSSAAT